MAQNRISEGGTLQLPLIVGNNTTLTGGTMVFADISGTNTLVAITTATEGSGFVGVMVNTQTGTAVDGSMTGVTLWTEGVFEFVTEANATGSPCELGRPVYAVGNNTVRGVGTGSANTITGAHPVGICVLLPDGLDETATSVRAWVLIKPFKQLVHVDNQANKVG